MKQSIINELKAHVQNLINDGAIDQSNIDDAHHIAFNEDYYIVGYYQADEWLKKHDVTPWEAIAYAVSKEYEHFGEYIIQPNEINSESVVNLIAYFAGYEVDIEEMLEDYQTA